MPSDEPSRPYNWRLKSLAKLKYYDGIALDNNIDLYMTLCPDRSYITFMQ